jgi:protein-tyrosine phosphatase
MTLVAPRVWLGGAIETAYDEEEMTRLGITHVLNCGAELHHLQYPIPVVVHVLALQDNVVREDTAALLGEGADTMREWLRDPRARVLVHCLAGVSRSAAVVLAYVSGGRRVTEALAELKAKRPCVDPFPPFLDAVRSLAA